MTEKGRCARQISVNDVAFAVARAVRRCTMQTCRCCKAEHCAGKISTHCAAANRYTIR